MMVLFEYIREMIGLTLVLLIKICITITCKQASVRRLHGMLHTVSNRTSLTPNTPNTNSPNTNTLNTITPNTNTRNTTPNTITLNNTTLDTTTTNTNTLNTTPNTTTTPNTSPYTIPSVDIAAPASRCTRAARRGASRSARPRPALGRPSNRCTRRPAVIGGGGWWLLVIGGGGWW